MARIEINTNVRDLLSFYREERRIFGRCPHCGDVFRLSDTKLTYGKEPPKDVLSRLKKERDQLEQQVADLDEQIASMESDHESEIEDLKTDHEAEMENADALWRERVDNEVERHLQKKVKEIRQKAIESYVQLDPADVYLRITRNETEIPHDIEARVEEAGVAIARRVLDERRNFTFEYIPESATELQTIAAALKRRGYETKLEVLQCDVETALERNRNRGNHEISCYFTQPTLVRWLRRALLDLAM